MGKPIKDNKIIEKICDVTAVALLCVLMWKSIKTASFNHKKSIENTCALHCVPIGKSIKNSNVKSNRNARALRCVLMRKLIKDAKIEKNIQCHCCRVALRTYREVNKNSKVRTPKK